MNKIEIVKKAFSFDTPPEEREAYFSDDYQFVDSVGSPPEDKEAWFGMGQLMQASIPDVEFIFGASPRVAGQISSRIFFHLRRWVKS